MADNAGIGLTDECLLKGNCELKIDETLQIHQGTTEEQVNLKSFVQDNFLSATLFIGTIATISLIIS